MNEILYVLSAEKNTTPVCTFSGRRSALVEKRRKQFGRHS